MAIRPIRPGLGPPVFTSLQDVNDFVTQATYHLYAVDLTGADGTQLEFTSPLKVRLDVKGTPMALLYQNSGIVLYDAADPPAAERWTLRRDQRTLVMGTAPPAGEPFLFLEVWAVL